MLETSKKGSVTNSSAQSDKAAKSSKITFKEVGLAVAGEAVFIIICVLSAQIDLTREDCARELSSFFDDDPTMTFDLVFDRIRSFWEYSSFHRNIWWD